MPEKRKVVEKKVVSKAKIEKLPVDCVLDVVRIQEKVNEIIDKING